MAKGRLQRLMMGEQRDQDDERNGYAKEVEQDRTHDFVQFGNLSLEVALPPADRGGQACRECSHQQRDEKPE